MNVFGVPMDANVKAWDNDQRRVGSIMVLIVAAVLLAAGVVVFLVAGQSADIAYWIFVGLLVLLLALEIALFAMASRGGAATVPPTPHHEGAPEPHVGPAGPSGASAPAARREARLVTLRCGDCGTEFEITDTGERPLHHVCPGCGLEGVLRAEGEAQDEGAVPPAPEPSYAPPASPYAPPEAQAPTPPPAAPVKKLKLRCGGCREVFSIEDTGERPLRRPCPFCGRTGEVR